MKAAFFCAGILSQDGNDSLQQQLMNKYQSGFELQTWSDLPHGSGLGTSSILAGTIIAALWRVVGKVPDVDSVVHAVSFELLEVPFMMHFPIAGVENHL